jgi:GST-like protein
MALRAADVPYKLVRASSWEPDTLPGLLHVNPLGQIPTLVLEAGTVLTESTAILLCLAQRHPEAGLLPFNASSLFQALRGLTFIAANCYPAVSVSDHPERWTTEATSSAIEHVRQAARERLHHSWAVFADVFSEHESLSPKKPGALAFLAVVVSQWSGTRAYLKAERPRFHAKLLRLERHPVVAAVLAEHRDA